MAGYCKFSPQNYLTATAEKTLKLDAQFYAPWCGHCRKLEPVMDEVATILKDKNTLSIAKIDATRYHKSASHFDVKAYPTIKL